MTGLRDSRDSARLPPAMIRSSGLVLLLLSPLAFANTRPAPPLILEPAIELQAVNGADVHMVTEKMSDADPGSLHRCTDWQIREGEEVIWTSPCAEGPFTVHVHLGDGTFTGNHASESEVRAGAQYELRVRHRDDSRDPDTEWSDWSTRKFQTVLPTPIPSMQLDEILSTPAPRWTIGDENVAVPADAALDLQTVDGDSLLRFSGDGIATAEPRETPVVVRLRLAAGDAEWSVPESELSFDDSRGDAHTVYVPAITLQPRAEAFFWISSNGGTHESAALDRAPDFEKIIRGAPVPWTFERGYRAKVFASGFELPVGLVAVPQPGDALDSPLIYVAELYGSVKVILRNGEVRTYATELLNFDPRAPIPGNGERGLGGITIDPSNGDIIVTGIYVTAPFVRWPSPRVLRLQSDDGGFTAARVIPVIEFPNESVAPSHQISSVTFGPDGKLYVHVGSSFSWIAQDMNTIDGKILRINGDGSAPADNPFYDAGNGITATDYIFALGFRNPFGGAWRGVDQSLYEVENGPTTDRLARVVAGRNYLWDGTDESMRNFAIYNWSAPVAPIQIAFTEPERFEGSGFPAEKMRSAFVTESGATWATGPQERGKRITEFVIGADDTLESEPTTFAQYNGSGKATAAGLTAGPDGLYFTDLYRDYGYESPFDAGANVFRVEWTGFAGFQSKFLTSTTIGLTDRSNVPDAESITWDFGDGTSSTARNPTHRYAQAGTYLVRQTVTGPRGTVTEARRVFAGSNTNSVLAEYFESTTAVAPAVVRSERSLQFDWSEDAPAPNLTSGFAARFIAELQPRFSETHTFRVRSNDRVRLLLDGKLLLDAWEPNEEGKASASIDLVAGRKYELEVEYVDDSDAPSLRVSWESASQSRIVVPQSVANPKRRAISPP